MRYRGPSDDPPDYDDEYRCLQCNKPQLEDQDIDNDDFDPKQVPQFCSDVCEYKYAMSVLWEWQYSQCARVALHYGLITQDQLYF